MKTFFALYGTDEYSAIELSGFENLKVRVLSYEDLAVMKLFSTRTKDLDDLIEFIFPKLTSYSDLKHKIETYKDYYFFNSDLPELNLNQMGVIKDRLRKEKGVLIVDDFSISLEVFLKSLRLLTDTKRTFGEDALNYWLDKPLNVVAAHTELLGYLYDCKGLRVLL